MLCCGPVWQNQFLQWNSLTVFKSDVSPLCKSIYIISIKYKYVGTLNAASYAEMLKMWLIPQIRYMKLTAGA